MLMIPSVLPTRKISRQNKFSRLTIFSRANKYLSRYDFPTAKESYIFLSILSESFL